MQPRVGKLRETEVENLDPVLGEHQVAWLDVAVHDALAVRLGESFGHLRRDLDGFVHRQASALEPRLQRLAVVVRHDDEQLPVVGAGDVVNRADVRVVGGGGGLRLAHEALLGALVVAPLRGQELQRNAPSQLRIARGIDDAHTAAAKPGHDVVVRHRRADERVHRKRPCALSLAP